MKQVSNRVVIFIGLIFSGFFWANAVKAICPVCVVAIGAGVGLCRWLGVDDTISGLWIGALIAAMIMWTLIWLRKKELARLNAAEPQSRYAKLFNWVKNFKFSPVVISIAYYLLIIWPLYSMKIMGHPLNKVFGMDKLLFGIISGSILFLFCHWLNLFLKNKNQGKVYFPYQKVVIPLVVLLVFSLIFYLIIKCY